MSPNYAVETLIFNGDLVEEVYKTANEQWLTGNGSMPAELNNWSYWFFDPTSDTKPVIQFIIIQEGVDVVDDIHTAPFKALGPMASTSASGTYLDLAAWTGISLTDGPCQKSGNANPRFPIYLKEYNTTAQKQIYDLFTEATTAEGTPFSGALFMFEGYSQGGVKSFDDDATAFAHRSENLLIAPLLTYAPNGTAADELASQTGNAIRDALIAGSGETFAAYVNYA